MPRRILACLLPLFCLLLTACTDTPSGQLTPVDVYVPPVTEVRSDAPASWTLTLDGATYTLTYRCTTASPRWPFELDVYTDEAGTLSAEFRSGSDRPAALSRSDLSVADGEALSEAEQKERAAAWLSACGVSVDGYAHCEAERFGDGSLLLTCYDTYEGYILLDGTDVRELTDKELSHIRNKQIGFIFQGYNLIPALNARENVELPLIYQGVGMGQRHDRALEALERVDMADRAGHTPSEMSGGQQQRVAIARAIAARPPIIMADEPTGALDSKTGRQVLEILHSLHADGTTIILITHDNGIAATAERIVRLSDGKIVADGTREEVGL